MRSLNLLSQLTTAARPSGNSRVNVAPRTWNGTCMAGVLKPVVVLEPLQFTLLSLPLQFTFELDSDEMSGYDVCVVRFVVLAVEYLYGELLR